MAEVTTKSRSYAEGEVEVGTTGERGCSTVTYFRLRLDTPMSVSPDGKEVTVIVRNEVMLEVLTECLGFAGKVLKKSVNDGTLDLVTARQREIE